MNDQHREFLAKHYKVLNGIAIAIGILLLAKMSFGFYASEIPVMGLFLAVSLVLAWASNKGKQLAGEVWGVTISVDSCYQGSWNQRYDYREI